MPLHSRQGCALVFLLKLQLVKEGLDTLSLMLSSSEVCQSCLETSLSSLRVLLSLPHAHKYQKAMWIVRSQGSHWSLPALDGCAPRYCGVFKLQHTGPPRQPVPMTDPVDGLGDEQSESFSNLAFILHARCQDLSTFIASQSCHMPDTKPSHKYNKAAILTLASASLHSCHASLVCLSGTRRL